MRCNCGVRLSFPWPDEAAYEALYQSSAYHEDEHILPFCDRKIEAERAAWMRLRVIESVCPEGFCKVMDVGAGHGAFVFASSWGRTSSGVDPHPLGESVEQGTWKSVKGAWDLITMFDVLEHLTRPLECLRHLRSCLSNGGVIVVEMPELYSPHHVACGEAWRHIKPREHICLYSREAFRKLAKMAGFEVFAEVRPLRGELGKMTYFCQEAHG